MKIQNYWLICFVVACGLLASEHIGIGIVSYLVGCALATNRDEVKEIGNW